MYDYKQYMHCIGGRTGYLLQQRQHSDIVIKQLKKEVKPKREKGHANYLHHSQSPIDSYKKLH